MAHSPVSSAFRAKSQQQQSTLFASAIGGATVTEKGVEQQQQQQQQQICEWCAETYESKTTTTAVTGELIVSQCCVQCHFICAGCLKQENGCPMCVVAGDEDEDEDEEEGEDQEDDEIIADESDEDGDTIMAAPPSESAITDLVIEKELNFANFNLEDYNSAEDEDYKPPEEEEEEEEEELGSEGESDDGEGDSDGFEEDLEEMEQEMEGDISFAGFEKRDTFANFNLDEYNSAEDEDFVPEEEGDDESDEIEEEEDDV